MKLDRLVLNTCACSATTLPSQGTVFNQCVPVKPGRVVLNTLSGQGARRRVRQEQAVSGRPQTVPRGRLRLRPRYDYTASTAAQLSNTIRYDTRCCFNVRSKANLPHGTKKLKSGKQKN